MAIKELLSQYIEERNRQIKEFNESIKANDKEWIETIKNKCTIKVGDVFSRPTHIENKNYIKYYIVSDIKVGIDGIVSISGNKLTNKSLWSKKPTYMFSTSIYNDFEVNSGFNKVVDNELNNITTKVLNAEIANGIIPEATINE